MNHIPEIIDNLEQERQQCFLDHLVKEQEQQSEYIFPEVYTMEDILDEDFAL
jgi:flagellar motor switch protein FliG